MFTSFENSRYIRNGSVKFHHRALVSRTFQSQNGSELYQAIFEQFFNSEIQYYLRCNLWLVMACLFICVEYVRNVSEKNVRV